MNEFEGLGLAPAIAKTVQAAGLTTPTPIQAKAIPLALEGRDVLGLAQTGTGKTLAFGLPLVHALLTDGSGKPAPKTAKALILAPTRELANQISASIGAFTAKTRLKIATVVGGQSISRQISRLDRGTDILVATPGRLIDLMERAAIDLGAVRWLVLDEADQMLDMGFIHALRRIAPALGSPRQTLLFSATMPKTMEELSAAFLNDPVRVQVTPPGKPADKITQSVHFLPKVEKPAKLREILATDPGASSIVFARTKHGAEKMMKQLVADGFDAVAVHGNKSQGQRDRALNAFRQGNAKVLVATDVAARGLDIPGVAYVINYDLPEVPENYVHRIGRTARAGREGEAITLCAPEEAGLLHQIQRVMKVPLPVASGTAPEPNSAPSKRPARGGKRRPPQSAKPSSQPGKPANKRRRPRRRRPAA